MKKKFKRFKYDLEYKDGYYERILYTLLALFIFCGVMVYILW